MSYVKVKNISIKPKENKITYCGASSNLFPITYYTSEYNIGNVDFEEKLGTFICDIIFGNMHLNNSLYKWNYAIAKTCEELNYNNCFSGISTKGEDLYNLMYEKYNIYWVGEKEPYYYNGKDRLIHITQEELKNGNYTFLYEDNGTKEYYNEEEKQADILRRNEIKKELVNVFLKYFNEKHNGKYYLDSKNYGLIKPKGTNGAFYYNYYSQKSCLLDFYKAFYFSKVCKRNNDEIEIKAYLGA